MEIITLAPPGRELGAANQSHTLRWAAAISIICLAPLLLISLGVDFSSGFLPMDPARAAAQSVSSLTDYAFTALHGSFTHAILEWTAVCAAVVVGLLALVQYRLTKEPSLPVIGIALVCAGAMDAFHTLAATRLIDAAADNRDLIPFTWAICRLFNGVILTIGVGIFAIFPRVDRQRGSIAFVVAICTAFIALSYVIIRTCAASSELPQTMFPNALIKRPYDLWPLVPYLLCAVIIYPMYMKRHKSFFAMTLFLAVIPSIATQLYMAFGSNALHDSCFNIAHGLKAFSYGVPMLGMMQEFASSYRTGQRTEEALRQRTLDLEIHRDTLETNREELRSLNESLMEANLEAVTAAKTKTAFLANMSHEIRTPMTAILGFAEALADEVETPEQVRAVTTIQRNGELLLNVINDILDVSKIEAGKLTIEKISCSPTAIVADVASLMQSHAGEKGLFLATEFVGSIPERIQTDPTRLKQILINLIGNAIKFTQSGGVRLTTECLVSGDESLMQFDVMDTGIGLSASQQEKIFVPFSQADESMTRKFGGTGLGLVISRALADALGGDLTLISTKEGDGSHFRATIASGSLVGVPMREDRRSEAVDSSKETSPPEAALPTLDCRVLLAEDGPDNQRLISLFLKKAGASVVVVENGQEAVEAALAALKQGEEFSVILMDMQMPVMDGYTAVRTLRAQGYELPIIALTAHAMSSDRAKCIDAGCDEYISKPAKRAVLLDTINTVVNESREQYASSTT